MNHLNKLFNSIADAIRTRKQTTDLISASDFPSEILSIPQTSTSVLQTKSITITSNGTTTLSPDTNYDGISSATITTNVSGGKLGGSFTWNHYNTSAVNNSQTYNITIPANKQYAIIVFVITAQGNTPRGSLEVTSKPSNITLSAIGSVNGGREVSSIQTTTYCYLATKTSNIASAATITFKNDWSDTGNGYGNGGCTYGVFYNV